MVGYRYDYRASMLSVKDLLAVIVLVHILGNSMIYLAE